MAIKGKIESALRNCPPLFRLGSRIYHAMNLGFKSLSPGAPGAIEKAFKLAKDLHSGGPIGDYYEFGLYKGYTFFWAYRTAKKLGLEDMRFFGFDSFQGLPEVEDVDKAGGRFFEGQFAYTRKKVEKNLKSNGVDLKRVKLIEGFYENTLNRQLKKEIGAKTAGIVMLDCDLYSSTSTALNWLEDLITDKTIVIFDDWYSFTEGKELGQQRALKEFLQRNKNLSFKSEIEFERNGKMFSVSKKD